MFTDNYNITGDFSSSQCTIQHLVVTGTVKVRGIDIAKLNERITAIHNYLLHDALWFSLPFSNDLLRIIKGYLGDEVFPFPAVAEENPKTPSRFESDDEMD